MYNSVLLLSLLGWGGEVSPVAVPKWLTSYHLAREQGKAQKKPLVVVIGEGANGYQRISSEGKLSPKILRLLADNYVCLYLDAKQASNRELIAAFGITGGRGLVISDRTGDLQAFRQEGELAEGILLASLQRFSDASVVVTTTETTSTFRVSYYPPTSGASGTSGAVGAVPATAPVSGFTPYITIPSFGGGVRC